MAPARRGSPRGSGGGERASAPGWRKRALAVRERGRWRTARGPAPRRAGTAGGALAACALAACAAVCVAVIAAVMAGRDVTA